MRYGPSNMNFRRIRFAEPPQAMVSFSFDDGYESQYAYSFPALSAKGVIGTMYVVTGSVGTGSHITLPHLNEIAAAGWEIGDHTTTHPNLTSLTEAQIEIELANSRADLQGWGFSPRTLAYPQGADNATVRRVARRYYQAARAVWLGTRRGPNLYPLRRYSLKSVQADDTGLEATFLGYIDSAAANKQWLIFHSHDGGAAHATMLGNLIDRAKDLGMPIVTVAEGITRLQNAIDVISYSNPDGFALGADGSVEIPLVNDNLIVRGAYDGTGLVQLGTADDDAVNRFFRVHGFQAGLELYKGPNRKWTIDTAYMTVADQLRFIDKDGIMRATLLQPGYFGILNTNPKTPLHISGVGEAAIIATFGQTTRPLGTWEFIILGQGGVTGVAPGDFLKLGVSHATPSASSKHYWAFNFRNNADTGAFEGANLVITKIAGEDSAKVELSTANAGVLGVRVTVEKDGTAIFSGPQVRVSSLRLGSADPASPAVGDMKMVTSGAAGSETDELYVYRRVNGIAAWYKANFTAV